MTSGVVCDYPDNDYNVTGLEVIIGETFWTEINTWVFYQDYEKTPYCKGDFKNNANLW